MDERDLRRLLDSTLQMVARRVPSAVATVRARLVDRPLDKIATVESLPDGGVRWELKPFVELAIFEIRDVVRRPHLLPPRRSEGVFRALYEAGL